MQDLSSKRYLLVEILFYLKFLNIPFSLSVIFNLCKLHQLIIIFFPKKYIYIFKNANYWPTFFWIFSFFFLMQLWILSHVKFLWAFFFDNKNFAQSYPLAIGDWRNKLESRLHRSNKRGEMRGRTVARASRTLFSFLEWSGLFVKRAQKKKADQNEREDMYDRCVQDWDRKK